MKKPIRGGIYANLSVEFEDQRTSRAVHLALLPDNHDFPEGMRFEQKLKGRKIEFTINLSRLGDSTGNLLYPLISTLDEIVSHIYTVTKTLEKVGTLNDRHKDSEREPGESKRQSRKAKYG